MEEQPSVLNIENSGGGVENQRICLIGDLNSDEKTIEAAKTFNVPILFSETGIELICDTEWTTYFVMSRFDGEAYNKIRKSKHRIYGPTALQQIAQSNNGLTYVNRPIYNFAMKGVITCITGIRKKDELTHLVDLIHAMGGSIRKDLNTRVTHLICNQSSGEKYQYAMTFRLIVIRSNWVHEAWERRSEVDFFAVNSEFSDVHKLRPFDGQKICFYGFSPEEHQEMVDVLKSNGGTPTDLEDPDCTHVILANNVDHFPDQLGPTSPPIIGHAACFLNSSMAVPTATQTSEKILSPTALERLNLNESKHVQSKTSAPAPLPQFIVDTPKKLHKSINSSADGIILPGNEENQFLEQNNLSPILHNIEEEEEGNDSNNDDQNDKELVKRKRDSFDNISIISTDTFAAQFCSAKKSKLSRTGSITRSLRRSMSFVALKNPISNMIRVRRNSIDPNASISSITSMESTFSESIKKPVKEKLQSLRNRITSGTRLKREFALTPKSSKKFINQSLQSHTAINDDDDNKFVLPNEISMLSCRKLANSTMHTIEGLDDVADETKIASNGGDIDSQAKTSMPKDNVDAAKDVADSAAMVVMAKPQLPPNEDRPDIRNGNTHIVKADWFWFTIQNGYANEMDHLYCDELESVANTPDRRDSMPMGWKQQRKRKRFSLLGASIKRRSSISDARLSVSGSFLDCTSSPNMKHESRDFECSMEHTPKTKVTKSKRYNHFMELCGTESNYVGILHTIVTLFQKPLEDMADTNDALLNKSELRVIFNNFSPIHEVHSQMMNHFRELQVNWSDDCMIGKIILDYRQALIKAYPPYVNFFEQMKSTLQQCDAQNPRFHAFLKINQSKPECGRQTLQDLMIRPVQRLPSMSLLINDILKHTPESHPDFKELGSALQAIKEVMTHINEDKRTTEGHLALFELFNDIHKCPAEFLASHRCYISKCEVTEPTTYLGGRDDPLVIFLLTDYIEICKIRKRFNTIKSPTGAINALNTTTKPGTHVKSYKHIDLIPLSSIKYVHNITDIDRAFAIAIDDKLYRFNISDDNDKIKYLKNFCKQLAQNAVCTDAEQFLHSCESHQLGIDTTGINSGTLHKVYDYARNVKRVFSFKQTPLKLKRAVSTTSPLYESTNSLM